MLKLWQASDCAIGGWYDVEEINPREHGRAESGEILHYYDEAKENVIVGYYWDDQRCEYRKYL